MLTAYAPHLHTDERRLDRFRCPAIARVNRYNSTTIDQLTAGAAVRGRVDREPVARNVSGAAPERGGVAALLRDGTPTACATTSSSSS
jgi:hypothetical protein